MAILFNDNQIKCPKCGKTAMIEEKVFILECDKKNKNVYSRVPIYNQIRCANCNEIVLKIDENFNE